MQEIGVTAYQPSEEGKPVLDFWITHQGKQLSGGTILQSMVFRLNDGEALVLMPHVEPPKP